ncbi:MAG: inorganic phosphate transporter [Betaproteobacteria bacterium]|nr:inorganic phosphate transporter [Betaproteobacteria bacterium]
MLVVVVVFIFACLVSLFNGANDNFKGFATVWGAGLISYRKALILSTTATVLGGLLSILVSRHILSEFTGYGFIVLNNKFHYNFVLAIAVGASITLLIATKFGFPVSTTHALLGALVGSAIAIPSTTFYWDKIIKTFVFPLLFSPLVSLIISYLFNKKALVTGILSKRDQNDTVDLLKKINYSVVQNKKQNLLHLFSAFLISLSRGINDTPKIASLLLVLPFFSSITCILTVISLMAAGGFLFAKPVAMTMSKRITTLDYSSGIKANLTTAFLVLIASNFGLPVSTTHVSVGSITGIGYSNSEFFDKKMFYSILLSWIITLPLSGIIAFMLSFNLNQ